MGARAGAHAWDSDPCRRRGSSVPGMERRNTIQHYSSTASIQAYHHNEHFEMLEICLCVRQKPPIPLPIPYNIPSTLALPWQKSWIHPRLRMYCTASSHGDHGTKPPRRNLAHHLGLTWVKLLTYSVRSARAPAHRLRRLTFSRPLAAPAVGARPVPTAAAPFTNQRSARCDVTSGARPSASVPEPIDPLLSRAVESIFEGVRGGRGGGRDAGARAVGATCPQTWELWEFRPPPPTFDCQRRSFFFARELGSLKKQWAKYGEFLSLIRGYLGPRETFAPPPNFKEVPASQGGAKLHDPRTPFGPA